MPMLLCVAVGIRLWPLELGLLSFNFVALIMLLPLGVGRSQGTKRRVMAEVMPAGAAQKTHS